MGAKIEVGASGDVRAAFSIDRFCAAHSISRPFLYKLWKAGDGPGKMKIGRRTLITAEAAAAWRKQHEERGATA